MFLRRELNGERFCSCEGGGNSSFDPLTKSRQSYRVDGTFFLGLPRTLYTGVSVRDVRRTKNVSKVDPCLAEFQERERVQPLEKIPNASLYRIYVRLLNKDYV